MTFFMSKALRANLFLWLLYCEVEQGGGYGQVDFHVGLASELRVRVS